jgi:hypothetical protein
MTMKINVIRTFEPPVVPEPSTKKQWAVAIGLLIILAYLLGHMMINCFMR